MEKTISYNNGDLLEIRTTDDDGICIAINDLEDTGCGYTGQAMIVTLQEFEEILVEAHRLVEYVKNRAGKA